MSKKTAWAIKTMRNTFVNRPPQMFWEADRVLLFRTRKQAQTWLENSIYWSPKARVVKVQCIIKEYMT